jgi:hypothetical protein
MLRQIHKNDWLDFEDKTLFEDANLTRFLRAVIGKRNWHWIISNHCHHATTDNDAVRLAGYFKNMANYICVDSKCIDNHFEGRYDLFMYYRSAVIIHHVIASIDIDDEYNEYRISGIRKMNQNVWSVDRTVFRVKSAKGIGDFHSDWKTNRTLLKY